MYYEINVVKNGSHFFATHQRSLPVGEEKKVAEIIERLRAAFPESEGYEIQLTRQENVGYCLCVDEFVDELLEKGKLYESKVG
jgi:hypothetical protein